MSSVLVSPAATMSIEPSSSMSLVATSMGFLRTALFAKAFGRGKRARHVVLEPPELVGAIVDGHQVRGVAVPVNVGGSNAFPAAFSQYRTY